jgi:hypothetical protein
MPVNQGETSRNDDLQRRFPKPSTQGKPALNLQYSTLHKSQSFRVRSNHIEMNLFIYLIILSEKQVYCTNAKQNSTTVVMGRFSVLIISSLW